MPELLRDVDFFAPRTLEEALELRASLGERGRVVAGGTDVMVWQEQGRVPLPESYLSVWGLRELRFIRPGEGRVEIGALTTYTDLIESELIQRFYPDLLEASRQIGALQIQNRGTLAGNVVNASPAGDTLPVLAVHDAIFVLSSAARGERRVAHDDFFVDYRKTALAPDELLVRIELPMPSAGEELRFAKVGSRKAQTISKVMAAMKASFDSEGRFQSVAVSFGAVSPVIRRLRPLEEALMGQRPSAALAERLDGVLQRAISPIDDVRSDAQYRRFLAAGLLKRFLRSWQPEGAHILDFPHRAS
ncbi:MAG: FAD binding domain-containing protein [Myxococcota bacterium]